MPYMRMIVLWSSHAVTKFGSVENTTAKTLSSKFLGLSGNISFRDGSLLDSSNFGHQKDS